MIWYWRSDDCRGQLEGRYVASSSSSSSWELYNEADCSKLEAAYSVIHNHKAETSKSHVSDEIGRTVILQRGSNVYICDIIKMEQTNLDTGFVRSICRGLLPITKKQPPPSEKSKYTALETNKKPFSNTSIMNSAPPSSRAVRPLYAAVATANNNRQNNHNDDINSYRHRVTEIVKKLNTNEIFVFGSNEAGRHGLGAAKIARQKWGAIYGRAEGIQGQTYGIPTKDKYVRNPLPLKRIDNYVQRFIKFASDHPQYKFWVTEIGCGLSGYTPNDIAPLFQSAIQIENISLPESFWKHLLLSTRVSNSCTLSVVSTTTTKTKTGEGAPNNTTRRNKFNGRNNH